MHFIMCYDFLVKVMCYEIKWRSVTFIVSCIWTMCNATPL